MRRVLTAILFALVLAVPATAHAEAGYQRLLNDCSLDEQISGTYTQSDYKQALAHMPADMREYTGCYSVIQDAQLQAAAHHDTRTGGGGGGGTIGGSGGGTPGTGAAPIGVDASGNTNVNSTTGVDGKPIANGVSPLDHASAEDRAAAVAAQTAGASPHNFDAAMIRPSDAASSLGSLPAPLLVLLGVLLVAGCAGLGLFLKRRVLGRHAA